MAAKLTFKRADKLERARALQFRDSIYEAETGHAPRDEFDDRAIHLIAVGPELAIVAAARMLQPEYRPFDFEQFLDISSVVGSEARIGLVGRFCVAPEHRQIPRSLHLHLGMLKLMYLIAKNEDLTHLILYTFDHLVNFYRGAHFSPLDRMTFFHRGYKKQMRLMLFDVAKFEADRLRPGDRLAATFASIETVT